MENVQNVRLMLSLVYGLIRCIIHNLLNMHNCSTAKAGGFRKLTGNFVHSYSRMKAVELIVDCIQKRFQCHVHWTYMHVDEKKANEIIVELAYWETAFSSVKVKTEV